MALGHLMSPCGGEIGYFHHVGSVEGVDGRRKNLGGGEFLPRRDAENAEKEHTASAPRNWHGMVSL